MNRASVNYSEAEGRKRTKLHRDEISLVMHREFFFITGTTCCKDMCNIHIRCISTNQRRSFLYVAYLKVAARQVSVRCQQVSISMEVGRKDPWRRRKWRLNLPSNRVKLNLSIEHSGHTSSFFLFSISLVFKVRLLLREYERFVLVITFWG